MILKNKMAAKIPDFSPGHNFLYLTFVENNGATLKQFHSVKLQVISYF